MASDGQKSSQRSLAAQYTSPPTPYQQDPLPTFEAFERNELPLCGEHIRSAACRHLQLVALKNPKLVLATQKERSI